MLRYQWIVLAALIALCVAVGSLAGWATSTSVSDWYPTLNKPSWNPPNWLFGPVWTVLYVMMAVAAWLVWKSGREVRGAMMVFFTQLALNFTWSFLFFGARSPGLGLIGVSFMLAAVAICTAVFFRSSRMAGYLMLPYLVWTAFAGFLNLTIWRLN